MEWVVLSVEKHEFFLSIPKTKRDYICKEKKKCREHEVYYKIKGKRKLPPDLLNAIEENIYFNKEPFTFVKNLSPIIPSNLEYLICCYETYQLSNLVFPPLFIKKTLELNNNVNVFSVTDSGSISPLIAIEWSIMTNCDTIIVCLEDIYSKEESYVKDGYNRADSLALFNVTKNKNPLQIIEVGHYNRHQSAYKFPDYKNAIDTLIMLTNEILCRNGLEKENTLIIPQVFSKNFINKVIKEYPHVYFHSLNKNFATSDPFYSLEEVIVNPNIYFNNIILLFIDSHGSIGYLLLRYHKVEGRDWP